MKKLPKSVMVFWKEYGDGTTGLVAVEKAADAVEEIGETIRVGKYELVEQADILATVTVTPTKKP